MCMSPTVGRPHRRLTPMEIKNDNTNTLYNKIMTTLSQFMIFLITSVELVGYDAGAVRGLRYLGVRFVPCGHRVLFW